MKVAFFALPLLAAFASARALGDLSERSVQCTTAFTKCLEGAASSGNLGTDQCQQLQQLCATAVIPRAAAPDPKAAEAQVNLIAQAFDDALQGKSSGVNTQALAAKIHQDVSANGFDIGRLIDMIVKAFGGKTGGIDIGGIINTIIKIIKSFFGHTHSLSAAEGKVDVGALTNVILSSMNADAKAAGTPIGDIIKEIISLLTSGNFDIAKIINLIIKLFKGGKANGMDVGQAAHGIMQLSTSSGLAARSEEAHAASLLDVPKIINEIIEISKHKPIDVGKMIQAIVKLIAEVLAGIGKFFIPGLGGLSARDLESRGIQAQAVSFDLGELINGITKIVQAPGPLNIGAIIQLIMKILGAILKPRH